MKIEVPNYVLSKLGVGDDAPHPIFQDLLPSWTSDQTDMIMVNTAHFSESQIKAIEDFLTQDIDVDKTIIEAVKTHKDHEFWVKTYKKSINKFKRWRRLKSNGDSTVFKSLVGIPPAFEGYLESLPNDRFYAIDEYERQVGWVATKCAHVPADRNGNPAYVNFKFSAFKNGEVINHQFNVEMSEIATGLKISDLLEKHQLFPETEEMNQKYDALILKMGSYIEDKGEVYTGEGACEIVATGRYSSYYKSSFYFKESQNKVVMDHVGPYLDDETKRKQILNLKHDIQSNISAQRVDLPIHPYVNVFHLEDHRWLSCHVECLDPYEFAGEELMNKLVLPDDHKTLINILMNMSKMDIEDIIKGKKGGSFIMATGDPGTGKTLTAEVFSEVIRKPLYKVQCSQLGLDVETVEKKLKEILDRASRWGAILLVDEADVYVRERGTDIEQNAIVGVFLRTLEYYTGILFMTSNMETAIDDAIMSRATAHLQYLKPSLENLRKIWEILSKQFNINLSEKDIESLIDKFPNLVGRDVKSLLKLGKMYSTSLEQDCDAQMIINVSGFVPNVNKTNKNKINFHPI